MEKLRLGQEKSFPRLEKAENRESYHIYGDLRSVKLLDTFFFQLLVTCGLRFCIFFRMAVTIDYLGTDLDIEKPINLLRLCPLYNFYLHDY